MEEKFTVSQAAVKNGLIVGLIGIVITTVNFMMALYESTAGAIGVSVISILVSVYFIIISHRLFKENNNGFMSYGQGLGIGVIISLISSIITGVFNVIYTNFVDDSSIKYQEQQSIERLSEQGMGQAEIDQAMEIAAIFQNPLVVIIISILVGTFFGFIISLIISAFTKKTDPSLEI